MAPKITVIKFYMTICTLSGPKTSQYLVWPQFASHGATHLLRIELIRLLIVSCWMLVHSSSMAVRSCWILAGTGTRCRIRQSQTYSMDDMSGEYAGHARTGMSSASRNCVQILATCACALSCCNMRWWMWMNVTTMGLRTVCAEILWLCKPIVAAAVWVAGLRRSWRWRCWMWRSWAVWLHDGLRLDVLANFLKCLWNAFGDGLC